MRLNKKLFLIHINHALASVCYTAGAWCKKNTGRLSLPAIILMLVHALWATLVLIRKQEKMITKFHRLSIIVWLIWLIPFGTGVPMNAFQHGFP